MFRNALIPILVLFAVIFLVEDVVAQEKSGCKKLSNPMVYTNYNNEICKFTDSASFKLDKKRYIARIILKIFWQRGFEAMPYTLYKDGEVFQSGLIERSDKNLFNTIWSKGYLILNKELTKGAYLIQLNDDKACKNSKSKNNGIITVLSCYKEKKINSSKKVLGADKSLTLTIYNTSQLPVNVFKESENFPNKNLIMPGQHNTIAFQLSPGEITTIYAGRQGQIIFYETFNYHNLYKNSLIELEYNGSEGFQNRKIYQMAK